MQSQRDGSEPLGRAGLSRQQGDQVHKSREKSAKADCCVHGVWVAVFFQRSIRE